MASGNTNQVSGCTCQEQTALEARHSAVGVLPSLLLFPRLKREGRECRTCVSSFAFREEGSGGLGLLLAQLGRPVASSRTQFVPQSVISRQSSLAESRNLPL